MTRSVSGSVGRLVLALFGAALLGPGMSRAQAQEPVPGAVQAPQPPGSVRLDSLVVRGNQRVDAAVIHQTAGLQPGQQVTQTDVQGAIRRLMATGNFASVRVLSQGEPASGVTFVIEVEERPFVAAIEFRGLESVSGRTVRDTLKLRENAPLDPNAVVKTEQMIRNLLAKAGVQVQSVDTSLVAVSQPAGAYRLIFNVQEGERLSIADVEFRGNEAFSDGELVDAMKTKPEGFWWFRTGKFDRDTFREDLATRLPAFYGARGYIDAAVVSDTLIVDPQTGKARLVIEVAEGPRYRLGEFTIEGNARFPTDELARVFTTQRRSVLGLPFGRTDERERGEVFDQAGLDAAVQRIGQMYRNEGYLFAQVIPTTRRVPADSPGEPPTVDVTLAISERSPFYINRVAIEGNTYTHESVIRNRIVVFPGDVYNEDRLIQSLQSISALGYFETPPQNPDILPNPEAGTVDIAFHVKEKQTANLNFGTAIGGQRGGGVSGFLGFSQPNLFGQGKQADVRVEYGYGRNSFQGSYTDPALFGTRNTGSVSVFHYSDRYSVFDEGRRIRTGASLQFGVPVPGTRWTQAFIGYSLYRNAYQAADEELCDPGSLFCQPDATASMVSLSLTRDTRSHPLFPVVGTRQTFGVSQTGGPLGGDGNFQKLNTTVEFWMPAGRLGGGGGGRPMQFALGLQARGGAIFGNASRFAFERFYLGGTQFGEQLRGYPEASITPFGFCDTDGGRCNLSTLQRVGNSFLVLSGEYALRFNDNLSVSLFADAGNVWRSPTEINTARLFRGAGIGATIVTPFGPLGLDWAYGFDRTDPGWKLHFKLGGAF